MLGKLAVGKYPQLPFEQRPESILSTLRTSLCLRSDIRPIFLWDALSEACPLKESVQKRGMDILVVRDIAGGMFMNDGCRCDNKLERAAFDTELYSENLIRDTARIAFRLAQARRRHITSLDKAILLASSVLWRQVVTEAAQEFPDVTLVHKLVDGAALQLVEHANEFDVIVASNIFGDIILDEVADWWEQVKCYLRPA